MQKKTATSSSDRTLHLRCRLRKRTMKKMGEKFRENEQSIAVESGRNVIRYEKNI